MLFHRRQQNLNCYRLNRAAVKHVMNGMISVTGLSLESHVKWV